MRTALSLAVLLATPAAAQQAPVEPTAYQRAIAAGYKATTLCSAMLIAGRKQADVEALELTGVYPEYDSLLRQLPAVVDRELVNVEVSFDPALPPRSASLGPKDGCMLGPIGAEGIYEMGEDDLAGLRPIGPKPADPRAWPIGDTVGKRAADPAVTAVVDAGLAEQYGTGARTTGIVVVKDGAIIAESYAPGFGPFVANRTWSVAKSITGTLIGIAGGMTTGAPVKMPQWSGSGDPRSAITLDNLLRMASGLHSDTAGNRTDAIYFGGTAVDEQAPFWPIEAKPGTRFRYANNDTLLAVYALRQSIGDERYDDLARSTFDGIGMRNTVAEKDWRGNYILSSQVWSTARDLARLGQLWLDDGVWQGKRILPEGWMRYMTTPSGPQPATGPGYGATLWLFGPAQDLPAGSYAAQGNRGQFVMVIPARRLVIVRRGEDPGRARFDIARFAADIAAAIR